MQRILSILLLAGLLAGSAHAQIGLNGRAHPSAALDVKATDKAFYPPRLTTAQRNAIENPQPGAFVYDRDKGTFYMFDGKNWFPLAFINTLADRTVPAADGNFGYSVAISGDYALIGSYTDVVGTNIDQGSAYVFFRSGGSWTQQAKLTAADGASNDNFGYSVAISGNYALVGSPYDDLGTNIDQGSAYVYQRTGTFWFSSVQQITDKSSANTYNGSSVGISNGAFVIGGYGFQNNQGKVAFGTVDN